MDKCSARRRDLYLAKHNTRNRQTSMPPAGFEPTISVGEGHQTYTLDGAATVTGLFGLLPEDFTGDSIPLSSNQYDKFTYCVLVSACWS